MNLNKIKYIKVDYAGTCAISGYRTNTKAITKHGEIYCCTHSKRCSEVNVWNKILNNLIK
tara:strand:+ start:235 stop:414 length:180 start_codon:yes stop_codon:yes gene_type:complete